MEFGSRPFADDQLNLAPFHSESKSSGLLACF